MTWGGTKVLVTANDHKFHGEVVEIVRRVEVQGKKLWIFEHLGTDYQLEDGQFKEVKVQS